MIRKLKKPYFSQRKIINDCCCNIRDTIKKNNLLGSKKTIIHESMSYNFHAELEFLSKILPHTSVAGGASKDEMVWLYDKKFVQDQGRKYYTKLMAIPPNSICPYCGQRTVSTLDHYLPKTQYPVFAVTPFNLVASCSECNTIKKVTIINKREDEVIHPYYDNFDDSVWIKAIVIEKFPISFNFTTQRPTIWTDEKYSRIIKHFETFELNSLYSPNADSRFNNDFKSIKDDYIMGDSDYVKQSFKRKISSCQNIWLNSWEAAMYEALLDNDWFYDTYLPSKAKRK